MMLTLPYGEIVKPIAKQVLRCHQLYGQFIGVECYIPNCHYNPDVLKVYPEIMAVKVFGGKEVPGVYDDEVIVGELCIPISDGLFKGSLSDVIRPSLRSAYRMFTQKMTARQNLVALVRSGKMTKADMNYKLKLIGMKLYDGT
jgi:hypothetical protein